MRGAGSPPLASLVDTSTVRTSASKWPLNDGHTRDIGGPLGLWVMLRGGDVHWLLFTLQSVQQSSRLLGAAHMQCNTPASTPPTYKGKQASSCHSVGSSTSFALAAGLSNAPHVHMYHTCGSRCLFARPVNRPSACDIGHFRPLNGLHICVLLHNTVSTVSTVFMLPGSAKPPGKLVCDVQSVYCTHMFQAPAGSCDCVHVNHDHPWTGPEDGGGGCRRWLYGGCLPLLLRLFVWPESLAFCTAKSSAHICCWPLTCVAFCRVRV